MKGKKTDVADDPELQRHKKNTAIQSNVSYHGEVERKETMEKIRPPLEEVVPPVNKGSNPGAIVFYYCTFCYKTVPSLLISQLFY